MMPWKAAATYLVKILPGDMKLALTVIASKKLPACVIFLGLLGFTLLVNLVAMWVLTGNVPSMAVHTDYWGLAVQRLTAARGRELPAVLLGTMGIYLDYPALWFTFERAGFEEQARTLAMDTTTVFPVLNFRYLLENAPIALLLTVYLILSRHQTKGAGAIREQKVTHLASISVPSGSSAVGSVLAPMACCGGTVVQSAAYIVGFMVTAPLAALFSRLATGAVGLLLVIAIGWTARRIHSGSPCVSR